ncbi:hypothetical protein K525DRAFT_275353 [Schizophyllum commune Loenen D]|nr:hypothetical protein K525DRAFT_275353 [Schizophyllum commune Loenen D]
MTISKRDIYRFINTAHGDAQEMGRASRRGRVAGICRARAARDRISSAAGANPLPSTTTITSPLPPSSPLAQPARVEFNASRSLPHPFPRPYTAADTTAPASNQMHALNSVFPPRSPLATSRPPPTRPLHPSHLSPPPARLPASTLQG